MKEEKPILERLIDLHKQATEERSHYYVSHCIRDAITEILRLQQKTAAFGWIEYTLNPKPLLKKRSKK